MTLDEIEERVGRVGDATVARALFDYLVQHHLGQGSVYFPNEMATTLGQPQDRLLPILYAFAGDLDILEGRWLFFDSHGEQFELSGDDVREALNDDHFYHPQTGAEVASFRDAIGLIFVSTPLLDAAVVPPAPSFEKKTP